MGSNVDAVPLEFDVSLSFAQWILLEYVFLEQG
jgi:hypothetical protein